MKDEKDVKDGEKEKESQEGSTKNDMEVESPVNSPLKKQQEDENNPGMDIENGSNKEKKSGNDDTKMDVEGQEKQVKKNKPKKKKKKKMVKKQKKETTHTSLNIKQLVSERLSEKKFQ